MVSRCAYSTVRLPRICADGKRNARFLQITAGLLVGTRPAPIPISGFLHRDFHIGVLSRFGSIDALGTPYTTREQAAHATPGGDWTGWTCENALLRFGYVGFDDSAGPSGFTGSTGFNDSTGLAGFNGFHTGPWVANR